MYVFLSIFISILPEMLKHSIGFVNVCFKMHRIWAAPHFLVHRIRFLDTKCRQGGLALRKTQVNKKWLICTEDSPRNWNICSANLQFLNYVRKALEKVLKKYTKYIWFKIRPFVLTCVFLSASPSCLYSMFVLKWRYRVSVFTWPLVFMVLTMTRYTEARMSPSQCGIMLEIQQQLEMRS